MPPFDPLHARLCAPPRPLSHVKATTMTRARLENTACVCTITYHTAHVWSNRVILIVNNTTSVILFPPPASSAGVCRGPNLFDRPVLLLPTTDRPAFPPLSLLRTLTHALFPAHPSNSTHFPSLLLPLLPSLPLSSLFHPILFPSDFNIFPLPPLPLPSHTGLYTVPS
jgi:hypothetical protein